MQESQKKHLLKLYRTARALPKGSSFNCAWCGDESHNKFGLRQVFCSTPCGNSFHAVFSPQVDGVRVKHPDIARRVG